MQQISWMDLLHVPPQKKSAVLLKKGSAMGLIRARVQGRHQKRVYRQKMAWEAYRGSD
jgi:hypothetical protein